MKPEDFVHLHVHSHFSTLDGSITVKRLLDKARDLGMKSLALTDHGTLSGILEFYQQARNNDPGIRPILGMEAYFAEGSRLEKQVDNRPSRIYHITLLARDLTGYHNLVKLSSAGYVDGFYRKPRIDLELLGSHGQGLIALSGCLSGVLPRNLLYDERDRADRFAESCREILGRDNFYVEVMKNGLREQEKVNPQLIDLARRLEIPLVATNDIHYLEQKDALVQEVLVCIQRGQTLRDEKRQRMDSDQFYFRSGQEMIELFAELPEAVENTAEIAARCDVELSFGDYHIPVFEPDDGSSPDEFLQRLCFDGAEGRYGTVNDAVRERMDKELSVIREMGFSSYFLIVWDFIRFAKEHAIPVGPGRGSAAGSVVAYSLGITELDPLEYDLLFERFLNSSRVSMPDIDIDFCIKGREKVVNYVRQKYGSENVCQIITFGTLAAKAALRDAGRVLDIDLPTVDRVAKSMPTQRPQDDKRSLIEIVMDTEPTIHDLVESDPRVKEWFDTSLKIEGLNRHPSTHAAGVVITDKPLTEYVPLCRVKDDLNTQFQMNELEGIGLLKMDFLGLKNLTVIDKALDLIRQNRGETLDLDNLPLNDQKTYELLQSGKAKGIFQLESSEGMSNLLVRLKPDCFEDIIALLALYRPGPLGSGMVDLYVERKHGRQEVEMLHESLSEILKETYGVIVYQEQVMRIGNVMAGFTLNEADKLRKVMAKKKPELMQKFRTAFIKGAIERKVPKKTAGDIFDKIEFFAGYGFNKSHSAAYALITYRTAYLKANYPLEYMAALMSCDAHNSDKISELINDCASLGIVVLGPDYNESLPDFSISGRSIRFGFNAIKGLGEKTAEAIVQARTGKQPFTDTLDMLERVDLKTMNKLSLETMIRAGAFDSTGINRASHFQAVEQLLTRAAEAQRDRISGQASLFGGAGAAEENHSFVHEIDEWDEMFKLGCEKEAFGFPLTSSPLKRYRPFLSRLAPKGPKELENCDEGTQLLLGGILEQHRVTTARRGRNVGKKMSFFKIRTLTGPVSGVLFSEAHERYGEALSEDWVYLFDGTVDRRKEEPSLIVSEVLPIDEGFKARCQALLLSLGPCGQQSAERLETIKAVCLAYPGEFDLLLHFNGEGRKGYMLKAGHAFRLNITPEVITEFEELVGAENVMFR